MDFLDDDLFIVDRDDQPFPAPPPLAPAPPGVTANRGNYYYHYPSSSSAPSMDSSTYLPDIEARMREMHLTLARLQADITQSRSRRSASTASSQFTFVDSVPVSGSNSVGDVDLLGLEDLTFAEPEQAQPSPVASAPRFAQPPEVPSSSYYPMTYGTPPTKTSFNGQISPIPSTADDQEGMVPSPCTSANMRPPSSHATSERSHITSPIAGNHVNLIQGSPSDRQQHCRYVKPCPIKVYYMDRFQVKRMNGVNGRVMYWKLRIVECQNISTVRNACDA